MSASRYRTSLLRQHHHQNGKGLSAHEPTIQSNCRPLEGSPHLAICRSDLNQPVGSPAYERSSGQSCRLQTDEYDLYLRTRVGHVCQYHVKAPTTLAFAIAFLYRQKGANHAKSDMLQLESESPHGTL